ncbi:hypothetical protein BOTBODRAFT_179192 [Botryobasidium botryosum FD-172 SS1]|uniref:F-box domain-containing protein n=1 Tax=Botryobasidium botryosum (strain FD-172 SS1) TaxID=930990 RepID=A0A067M383_BOTB1|nr:hypothetical protein BOTBODRAFT_179192 [Botryobasidium botryosum FD-172 SS1]
MSVTTRGMAISSLPVEILLEILEYNPASFLGASHVCSLWREAIHRRPLFWAVITLDVPDPEVDGKAAYWLQRAGGRSLAIKIRERKPGRREMDVADDYLVPLAKVLRESVDRWEKLSVEAYPGQLQRFFDSCAGHAPTLREITIISPLDDLDPISDAGTRYLPLHIPFTLPTNGTREAHTTVKARGCFPVFASFGTSITELSIEGWTTIGHTGDLLEMLQSCPNLTKCHLALTGPPTRFLGRRNSFHHISLPHLADFQTWYIPDPESLLTNLDLPSLRVLGLSNIEWSDTLVVTLGSLLRASPLLAKISLTDENYYEDSPAPPILGELHTLNSVTHFTVYGNTIADLLLRRLTLPSVQELSIHDTPFEIVHQLISSSADLRKAFLRRAAVASGVPILPLLRLTSLRIIDHIEILEYLHLPQLESLVLGDVEWPSHWPPDSIGRSLLTLIERSAPPLVFLELISIDIPDDILLSCLKQLPHLEELHLCEYPMTDSLVRALSAPSEPTTHYAFLPRLKKFKFYLTNITPNAFIEFIASRVGSALPADATGVLPLIEGKITFEYDMPVTEEEYLGIQSYGDFVDGGFR